MTTKYYTPELEEFHDGFEFQYKAEEEWFDMDYTQEDISTLLFEIENNPEFKTIVKYLDREDIESLGYNHFKHNPKGAFSAVDYYRGYSAGLTHYHDTNTVIIYEQLQGDMEGETWFKGKIKNKSELKKVLKMIGV
jgi:hypothetical protein